MTLLIVNADDFGLTEAVSHGIIDAHRDGIVTSTSVLALAPGFEKSHHLLQANTALGVGCHLALVGEDPPLLDPAELPSLVDPTGALPDNWRSFCVRYARGGINDHDVRRELSAQLQAVRDAVGRPLTHLDTHQHIHLLPRVLRIVIDLAREHSIPAIRLPRASMKTPSGAAVTLLAFAAARAASRAGLDYPGRTFGHDTSGHLGQEALHRTLHAIGRARPASAELMTHPGRANDPDRARYAWGFEWGEERAALVDPSTARLVEELGLRLGTHADLASV